MPPDSVRRALTDIFARPEYQWVEERSLGHWALSRWRLLQEWLDHLAVANPAAFKGVLAVLLVVLLVLVVHLAFVLWQVLRPHVESPVAGAPLRRPIDPQSLRVQAAALAADGRYAEALGQRFLATLLELEQARALAFNPAKTPAEFAGEARLDATGRAAMHDLVTGLYRHLFGAEPCDARAYRTLDATAEAVVRHVAPG